MNRKLKFQTLFIVFIIFGIVIYWATQHSVKKASEIKSWYSSAPANILSEEDAQIDINNIKTLQNAGWKLLMQDGQPVSFNEEINGRNEIIEKSAQNLFNGCYELNINAEGEVLDIKPSNKAKKIYRENHEVDY
ncbi:hypothetical protein [Priestia megaterium]|uniref:hypothetical protein n=1 Tax=Priestia megaterium TaxID=1404 RepID=UPI00301DEC10